MTVEVAVPPGETPAVCPHCGRPFRTDRARALHLGEAHAGVLGTEEREAVETARDAEGDALFRLHLRVVGGLTVLYSGLVVLYMAVASL